MMNIFGAFCDMGWYSFAFSISSNCSTNISLLLDDDFEFDRRNRRDRGNQLEDIRDWNSGNKSIAGEAIDKFKEIVGRVKFFDAASDYPYVKTLLVLDIMLRKHIVQCVFFLWLYKCFSVSAYAIWHMQTFIHCCT